VCVCVDLPCTSELNVKSTIIKPLAVGLFGWKLLSPTRITFGVRSGIQPKSAKIRSGRFVVVYR